jgi:1,2-diacylglycerol 3-beta-galactosyltransferase
MTLQANPDGPRLLFLFSDTGGGHRSAAEAVREALTLEYEGRQQVVMVDIFKEYAPRPLNRVPELYPRVVKWPRVWSFGYRLSDGYRRARLMTTSMLPYIRRGLRDLIASHPSDAIISFHPLANTAMLRMLGSRRPPFLTVVTDLVSTHAMWYDQKVDLCMVPTEAARQRALHCGLEPERVKVVGLPVAEKFCRPAEGRRGVLRSRLGWPRSQPVILLVGGGEGMGPLEELAGAIDRSNLPATLVIIAGRNRALQARLERREWQRPTRVYGFTREMPDLMRAADILVTKAGPGTLSEAFNAGLPLILYDCLPGQEEGNVTFVVSHRAGVWAPRRDDVVSILSLWLDDRQLRHRVAAASRKLARPQAARTIAHLIHKQLEPAAQA